MWLEAILVLIIIPLILWIAFFGGGTLRTQKLTFRIRNLQDELQRIKDANEGLRASLESKHSERTKLLSEICILTGDLEQVKAALAGSRTAQKSLKQKYDADPSPDLIDRILESVPRADLVVRQRLAHEILVGETGRAILRSLSTGAPITQAAIDADVPVVTARKQVKTLRTLGYLDEHLRPTELGQEALIQAPVKLNSRP